MPANSRWDLIRRLRVKKHWNNKFYYAFASCWLFLYDYYTLALTRIRDIFKPPGIFCRADVSDLYLYRLMTLLYTRRSTIVTRS